MKNNWIGAVLGETAPTQPVKAAYSAAVKSVLGEEEEKKESPKTEPKKEAPEPAAKKSPSVEKVTGAEKAPTADAPVADPGEGDRVSDPVQALAAAWSSGGKMDVAVKLLTEPVKYTDFVGLIQAVGPESAMELGQMLDELVAGQGEQPPTDNVLDRVDGFKNQRLGGTGGEEELRDFRERHAEGDVAAINQGEQ